MSSLVDWQDPWAVLFVPFVTRCPLWPLLCTRCSPHRGSWARTRKKKERDLLQTNKKTSNCGRSFQTKHCCLSKEENELKNTRYIYSGGWRERWRCGEGGWKKKEEASFTANRESFFLDRAMPTNSLLISLSTLLLCPILSRQKADYCLCARCGGKVARHDVENYF